ncbi:MULTISPECIES: imidazole glycerol phosphate synthase subunit HisH [unclassified Campylobacter]|uniref:imidazole glycerol phosphate synthase subunit HisH n=1 Tax=unclassified Campylobacter TaxID=2593542 RepID=UPI001237AA88|nr:MULTISPECIES: imidazole glycerol phosphate synthase subunit HisH [unclassified Campylobacter]KAA6226050.1 imidazole glycerol phosphate synthase subunit HisH [Campylobacter sp. LR196d]KAA6226643.1 imidazole glycerol phosphate synthase subunit HisH [Campylobacter sp. LR286c]KAA6227573.1 imidazole glycerol phosphate synthase subunit HisH [Campylobacter sp. LR185c]KAA6230013.1 imidazole glycerol phosphate synthase subunit HisH [Campylobacter sp. LR291e]KAA6230856.1 imidazole glycerol phosphate 
MKLVIIDTACANLASLKFSLDRLGVKSEISRDLDILQRADKLFLPGVGTAFKAMENLKKFNLIDFLQNTKKPLLGICLGMQLLGAFSRELNQKTLGIMNFEVIEFEQKDNFTYPHMGWNDIKSDHPLFKGLDGAFFYFVHSFLVPINKYTIASCEYSQNFSASICKDNFYGVQFHPERSAESGEILLRNFIKEL